MTNSTHTYEGSWVLQVPTTASMQVAHVHACMAPCTPTRCGAFLAESNVDSAGKANPSQPTACSKACGTSTSMHHMASHLPAQTPSTQHRALPIVLHKAHVMCTRVDAQGLEGTKVQLLGITRVRLQNDLHKCSCVRSVGQWIQRYACFVSVLILAYCGKQGHALQKRLMASGVICT